MAKKGLRDKKMGHGRNDLCPCGSGLKYKKCCKPMPRMKTDEEQQADEERRKKLRGASASDLSQFIQVMASMNMRRMSAADYGVLPERVSVDER